MFWKGKVGIFTQVKAFILRKDLAIALDTDCKAPIVNTNTKRNPYYGVHVANLKDVEGIVKLLNRHFEPANSKAKTAVTAEWLKSTFINSRAIWIVARDPFGTVRGCVSSFECIAPYPNSLGGCSSSRVQWGIVDWFCVEPLWRDIGAGSQMLEALDLVTYRVNRKAHVFLKEGLPLYTSMKPQLPFYSTFLRCRRAGNPSVVRMREGTGLAVYMYHTVEKDTELPLVRIEGIRAIGTKKEAIEEWEDALDKELPPCWVFVSGADIVDDSRGWKLDSPVFAYAFRWIPGKWFGCVPHADII